MKGREKDKEDRGILRSKACREGVQLSQKSEKHSEMMSATQPEASKTDTGREL